MHKVETLYEDPDPNHFDARTKAPRTTACLGAWQTWADGYEVNLVRSHAL